MADDFRHTTLPSTLDSRPGLDQTGRLLLDCATPRLGTLLLGNLTPKARSWLESLASQCAADGQAACARAIDNLRKVPRLGIALGEPGCARANAFAVLLALPTNAPDETPIGYVHASVTASLTHTAHQLHAEVKIHSAWIAPTYRLRGHSRLLAVAAGEAVAHTLTKARQHTARLPVQVKLTATPPDVAARSFVDACSEEMHLALLEAGINATVQWHTSLLDTIVPGT